MIPLKNLSLSKIKNSEIIKAKTISIMIFKLKLRKEKIFVTISNIIFPSDSVKDVKILSISILRYSKFSNIFLKLSKIFLRKLEKFLDISSKFEIILDTSLVTGGISIKITKPKNRRTIIIDKSFETTRFIFFEWKKVVKIEKM